MTDAAGAHDEEVGPALGRPVLLAVKQIVGPPSMPLPEGEADGLEAFDDATRAYDDGRDVDAARGFVRAAAAFAAERPARYAAAMAEQSAVAYENAAIAFGAAGTAEARDEGRAALAAAKAGDPANAAKLDALVAQLR